MKIKHMLQKGQRCNCSTQKNTGYGNMRFHRIPIYWCLTITQNDTGLWWCNKLNRWETIDNIPNEYSYSTHSKEIHSVKAAISHVKRHNELPKGTKLRLCSNFVGCDVIITK